MLTLRQPRAVQARCLRWRAQSLRVGFVPTMGALHAGHLSLVRRARRHADRVVASIFVNPLQFGAGEDYRRYPRTFARDRRMLAAEGVDLLFHPQVRDLYPAGEATRVRVIGLDEPLCGRSRPGHFTGVATVVMKLLGIVQPDVLWLGQKDAQQAALLERMVGDLFLPIEVRRAPIVRDTDGLALSSRNAYLSPEERRTALSLARGLEQARRLLAAGERAASKLKAAVRGEWRRSPGLREDYVEVVDPWNLEPVRRVEGPVLLAVAAYVGRTRLIDNLTWPPSRRRTSRKRARS